MDPSDTTILGQANAMLTEQELARVAREKANSVGAIATADRSGRADVTGYFQRTGKKWAATFWGKWTRQPGPDDGAIGVDVKKQF
jgi:hypothetical protein